MSKSKKKAELDICAEYYQMKEALEYYKNGIDHFYKCINFGKSALDSKAIEFMNDSNIKINAALAAVNGKS